MTPADLPTRMASKILIDGDCWIWTGARNSRGYSSVGFGGKSHLGHRRAYELLVGPIPVGLTLDHLCRTKECINPMHLEPVTAAENTHRKPLAPTCPHGHVMYGENLRIKVRANGSRARECRACQALRVRANYVRLNPERKPRRDRINPDAYLATH